MSGVETHMTVVYLGTNSTNAGPLALELPSFHLIHFGSGRNPFPPPVSRKFVENRKVLRTGLTV